MPRRFAALGLGASLVVACCCLMLFSPGARAQSAQFSIDWYKISGGGGGSTGGVYSLSGTIGQPDAGAMSGGNYSLAGGFWSIITAAAGGPPFLAISAGNGPVLIISWPASLSGYQLQSTPSVLPVAWTNVPQSPTLSNGRYTVSILATNSAAYFRLVPTQ